MDDAELTGTWKRDGFVFAVPGQYRPKVHKIMVTCALARVLRVEPSLFYLIIPKTAFEPDKWLVSVDLKNGVLSVAPPEEIVDLEGSMEEPIIGFVLPRPEIRIYD